MANMEFTPTIAAMQRKANERAVVFAGQGPAQAELSQQAGVR
jgi:hypothetical protein